MSSSSFSSDSDEFEPVRKIKINIRPKDETEAGRRAGAADVNQIRASVEAWRPLGPPTHPSLIRRQSSLSSVSSMSFGAASSAYGSPFGTTSHLTTANQNGFEPPATLSANANLLEPATVLPPPPPMRLLQTSPSCSSLVNPEYTNHKSSAFNNFISSSSSRTSSPLTLLSAHGQTSSDSIPIAVAIQESIELIVRSKDRVLLDGEEPRFETQALGNIKIAFPHAFVKSCSHVTQGNRFPTSLKMLIYPVDNIIKYYASGLIRDLADAPNSKSTGLPTISNKTDPFGISLFEEPHTTTESSKLIEFDLDKLSEKLKKLYDQSNLNKYYSVDFLRYQVRPINLIEQSPLQVCAYWKIEQDLIKLRIYFAHSSGKNGVHLERLRDISFTVNLSNFLPAGVELQVLSPHNISSFNRLHNNNNSGTTNMNNLRDERQVLDNLKQQQDVASSAQSTSLLGHLLENNLTNNNTTAPDQTKPTIAPLLPPPTTLGRNRPNHSRITRLNQINPSALPRSRTQTGMQSISHQTGVLTTNAKQNTMDELISTTSNLQVDADQQVQQNDIGPSSKPSPPQTSTTTNGDHMSGPFIVTEPRGTWNNSIRQLTWKFDTLLSYRKTNGAGCLFAKLDLRNRVTGSSDAQPSASNTTTTNNKPPHVDVKFFIADSTLSKINLSLESTGYRMTMLKKEVRSGRYRSEPYIVN